MSLLEGLHYLSGAPRLTRKWDRHSCHCQLISDHSQLVQEENARRSRSRRVFSFRGPKYHRAALQPFSAPPASKRLSETGTLLSAVFMGRVSSNRRLAEALLKTIRRLEEDPAVDSRDAAFIHLKCNLIQRLMTLEVDAAEVESQIHLVETQPKIQLISIFEPRSTEADGSDSDEDSWIA